MPEPLCSYTIDREADEINLTINCMGCIYYPAIEDNAICMRNVMDKLLELGNVTTITLSADRNYVYPYEQVKLLNEIRDTIVFLMKEKKVLSLQPEEGAKCTKCYAERFATIRYIMELVRADPIGAYIETIREIRRQKILQRKEQDICPECYERLIKTLTDISSSLEKTKLIDLMKEELPGYEVGNRALYRIVFHPLIKPNFMFTRLMVETPIRATEVDSYTIGKGIDVTIYKVPSNSRYIYHILPPEFKLSEEEYSLLSEARELIVKYKPKAREFVDPARMREVFFSISKDLLEELSKSRGTEISYNRIGELSEVLVRLTVGFGLTEVLLFDSRVEDVYINGPIGKTPIIIKHADYGECETNIIPNIKDAEAWATRFRMLSGRALDEANPVLDTELELPHARARVCIVQGPLSPVGLSYAFRHHRPWPWTLPLYIKQKMISPLAAGLISFLVDGSRSILIAGTRGTGKTSLLGSLIGEILRRYRTIVIEDTLEIPVSYFRNLLQYDILSLKVRSALAGETGELSADEGIRASLRLGDSALIVGEVRSTEAKALFEAMRIGAMANVVAGTIHADSPYGVFDRIVNDLGVTPTSFKATDVAVIATKVRDPSGLREVRRVVNLTEVRKHWKEDPSQEGGFLSLMEYDAKEDSLKPTPSLIEGESETVKAIASRVRAWVGNWDLVWENILLRSKVKKMLVDYADTYEMPDVLEAKFSVEANEQFHVLMDDLTEEVGYPEPKDVLSRYEDWLKVAIKTRKEI